MKLKYKKIIMLTTMSTLGIGMLTLSISSSKNPRAEESNDNNAQIMVASEAGETESAMLQLEPTPTPTPIPTPTPLPIYDIEKPGAYPEIDNLFNDYYAAKHSIDVDKLKTLLSDASNVETVEKLQSMTEYIDDYRNIKSYVKKGIEKGSYIVYVYHEIKFTSVTTPAPGLSKFYVITDEEGNLKIFSEEMDETLKDYFEERNNDKDVQELIRMTEDKGEEAKEKDEDLLKFWEDIDKLANNEQSEEENSSQESE